MDIAEKELISWLSALAVFFYAGPLNCLCSFPVWCLQNDVEFDCAIPDNLLFIYTKKEHLKFAFREPIWQTDELLLCTFIGDM